MHVMRVGRREVRITHPDKVLFPDGITKADLASYYRDVAPAMLPHVRDRPLSLQRFNKGIEGDGFFQKDLPGGAPDWVRRVRVPKRGGTVCHALANEAATLVWMANLNAVTPHVWTARADRLDRPDRIVWDLDPSGEDQFGLVRRTALELGDVLRDAGCEPFAMTTGSRGLHVVVALRRRYDYERVRDAALAVAEALVARHPDELTTAFRKERRAGRLFVDVNRNAWAMTAVPPYAVRPRPGAPVAAPLRWEELEDPRLTPGRWTLRTMPERLERHGDPWAQIGRSAGRLPRLA
ncbi:MAG: bifunctional non-ous end joining protein LigD [Solirubrobacteraceae bacterium]|jgi:bifunctional non-homologous end joining protein LigD|nr:bifunctional non-ous end joining protein LigD [Solirubrobacteraceae bacterium]